MGSVKEPQKTLHNYATPFMHVFLLYIKDKKTDKKCPN